MTLIWDVGDADRISHTPRLLIQGKATITQTSKTTAFKLEDDSNQLAYHIKHPDRCITLSCDSTNNTFAVAGDKHLFFVILKLGSDGKNIRPYPQPDSNNTDKGRARIHQNPG
jgi:hypothetical protein